MTPVTHSSAPFNVNREISLKDWENAILFEKEHSDETVFKPVTTPHKKKEKKIDRSEFSIVRNEFNLNVNEDDLII